MDSKSKLKLKHQIYVNTSEYIKCLSFDCTKLDVNVNAAIFVCFFSYDLVIFARTVNGRCRFMSAASDQAPQEIDTVLLIAYSLLMFGQTKWKIKFNLMVLNQ